MTLSEQVHSLEPRHSPTSSGRAADSEISLQRAAIGADAVATANIELRQVWHGLASGRCSVVDAFFSHTRCYLVLARDRRELRGPVESRRFEILEAVLGGSRQKCIAIDLGVAPSTVALQFKLALAALGVSGRPSRAHPLLMLIAGAAHETKVARRARFVWQERELNVIAIPRPERLLQGVLPQAELKVVRNMVEGLSYREIARLRGTSTRTIANQVSAVFRRLNVSGRNELVQRLLADPQMERLVREDQRLLRSATDAHAAEVEM